VQALHPPANRKFSISRNLTTRRKKNSLGRRNPCKKGKARELSHLLDEIDTSQDIAMIRMLHLTEIEHWSHSTANYLKALLETLNHNLLMTGNSQRFPGNF
jgi:hypothetical protein